MTANRRALIEDSNNPDNPNYNVCGLEVCKALDVESRVRYIHTLDDIFRAIQKKYSMRDLTPSFQNMPISKVRRTLRREYAHEEPIAFLVYLFSNTDYHVLLLDENGKTLVDTDPAEGYDPRQIMFIHAIL